MYKKLLSLIMILPFLTVFFIQKSYSNKNNPPSGHTGAISEPSCGFSNSTNSCHGSTSGNPNGSTLATLNTDVKMLIGATEISSSAFEYTPDSVYNFTLKLDNPNTLNGFSLTAENNGSVMSNSFSIPAGSSAVLNVSNSNYINQDGNAGVSEWDFNWTAPAQGSGDVTFFATVNRSNNNNNWSGDEIIPFELKINEAVDASVGVSDVNFYNEISKMKNPIINDRINFQVYVKKPKKYFVSIYDLSGKRVSYEERTFHAGLKDFETPLTQKGIFILNIQTNQNESANFKILNK